MFYFTFPHGGAGGGLQNQALLNNKEEKKWLGLFIKL
jgi:hypothetical protein